MVTATDVSVARVDGPPLRGHLALPGSGTGLRAVVVIHEIYGLTDDIRRITRRFAEAGYAALAPDLYDGPGLRAICIARTMLSVKTGKGPVFDDIEAARAHLVAHPSVDGARVGITGFCLGGAFAILAAVGGPYRVSAPYYGDVPKQAARLEGICPVVAGYGARDAIFAPQGARLERHLDVLGVQHDVKIYPEAGHSYMSHHPPTLMVRLAARGPMKAGFSETASEDSWTRMLEFFGKHL